MPPKRTIAILTSSGVALSLIAPHNDSFPVFQHRCPWQQTQTQMQSFSSALALSEEKGKRPHVWVQLQMCQRSGVKDESTRMWRKPRRTGFQWKHSSLEGGPRPPFLVFSPYIAPLRGLVLWRLALTKTVMWKACQCHTGGMSAVSVSGWTQVGMSFSGRGHRSDLTFRRRYSRYSSWLD